MSIVINNYQDFRQFVGASVQENFDMFLVEGPGGMGKTQTLRSTLEKKKVSHVYINGYTTVLSFVQTIFEAKDKLLVIDDVDTLLRNRTLVSILKQLCDTTEKKLIQYHSTDYRAQLIPPEFYTKSKVIIILNDLGKVSPDLQAFLTRGIHVLFKPTVKEVLKQLKTFATDKEVITFFENVAWQLKEFNLRAYVTALQCKNAKLDWKEVVIENLDIDRYAIVAKQITEQGGSFKERGNLFKKQTGFGPRTYARYVERMEAEGVVSRRGFGRGRKTTVKI